MGGQSAGEARHGIRSSAAHTSSPEGGIGHSAPTNFLGSLVAPQDITPKPYPSACRQPPPVQSRKAAPGDCGWEAEPLHRGLAGPRTLGRVSLQVWAVSTGFTPPHLKQGLALSRSGLLSFQTYINFRLHGVRQAMAAIRLAGPLLDA